MLKKISKLIFISMMLSFLGSLFSNESIWTSFINYLFLAALLLLMLGGSLFVLKGGMFNGILYSFRRLYKQTCKLEGYVSQQTAELHAPSLHNISNVSLTYSLIISGALLFLFTLISAWN